MEDEINHFIKNNKEEVSVVDNIVTKYIKIGTHRNKIDSLLRKDGFKVYHSENLETDTLIGSKNNTLGCCFRKEIRVIVALKNNRAVSIKGRVFVHGL